MWMARRVHGFLNLLSSDLVEVHDAASLRDALEASVFFASSMGRLGAEFTAQLPALFEPKMISLVNTFWKNGVSQLEETLTVCRDAGVGSPLVSRTEEDDGKFCVTGDLQSPPRQLLAFPPLARLVNAILTGLNELRRCLLPGIFPPLRSFMQDGVIGPVDVLLQSHERGVLKPGFRGETALLREVAAQYREVFSNIVVPYMRGALELALGNTNEANSLFAEYATYIEKDAQKKAQQEQEAVAEGADDAVVGEVEDEAKNDTTTSQPDVAAEPAVEQDDNQDDAWNDDIPDDQL